MARISIDGDVGPIRKKIKEVEKDVVGLGRAGGKNSIISESDKKFVKSELNREFKKVNKELLQNKKTIAALVIEARKLTGGSKEELEHRKRINREYEKQKKIAADIAALQAAGAGGGGTKGGLLSKIGGPMGAAAAAVGGYGVLKGYKAMSQYQSGVGERLRLKGLGFTGEVGASPSALADSGLTEAQFRDRQIKAGSLLGRGGGASESSILQKARTERAYGLGAGTFTNISGSLRGSMGTTGANEAQMKVQASFLANGIEDALAPYLDTANSMLQNINENGSIQISSMLNLFGYMTKQGQRTPEQIAKIFQGVDSAIKGSTGEVSAFIQSAFAKAGIGGSTIGGTRYAAESGGMFGLDPEVLKKRGYNDTLLNNMKDAGMFKDAKVRAGAVLNQLKVSMGMNEQDQISDITDVNTLARLNLTSNKIFGTQGDQGQDFARELEKFTKGGVSEKQIRAYEDQIKKGGSPEAEKLAKINTSLAGQSDILETINTNLKENLGGILIQADNIRKRLDNIATDGLIVIAKAAESTGIVGGIDSAIDTLHKYTLGGGIGSAAYDVVDSVKNPSKTEMEARAEFTKKYPSPNSGNADALGKSMDALAEKIGLAILSAFQRKPVQVNVQVPVSDRPQ